jgi:hypothetical protein
MRHPRHGHTRPTVVRAAIAASALALAGAAACGPMHRSSSSSQPPALLYFTNESLDQADVFAVTSGSQRIRIGTVFAGRTDTLTVPREVAARGDNVNLVVRLLARSATPSSGPVPIRPGDHLVVRLPSDQKMLVVLPGNQ